MPVGLELCACTYSASSKLMPAVLSETVAVTASVVFSFLFIHQAGPARHARAGARAAGDARPRRVRTHPGPVQVGHQALGAGAGDLAGVPGVHGWVVCMLQGGWVRGLGGCRPRELSPVGVQGVFFVGWGSISACLMLGWSSEPPPFTLHPAIHRGLVRAGDADAFGTIADCYTDMGDFDKAAAFYDK